jgi:hypothetical protein
MDPESTEKARRTRSAPGPERDLQAWLAGPYAKAKASAPERKSSFQTTSGVEILPL